MCGGPTRSVDVQCGGDGVLESGSGSALVDDHGGGVIEVGVRLVLSSVLAGKRYELGIV